MLKFFLKRLILKHKTLIFHEAQQMQGFLILLFKERNTDVRWTGEEKEQIRKYLRHLSVYVPAILIFLLPGGSLLLPVLAEILDRRRQRRAPGIPGEEAKRMGGEIRNPGPSTTALL